jgi:tetratricopeptide (TPR) repeat protein
LLALLDPEELKAVVSHEMGHIRRLHLPFFLLFLIAYSVLTYSLHGLILLALFQSDLLLDWATSTEPAKVTYFSIAYSVPILLMLILYFRFIFGFFLRNCERQADLYALNRIGHPFTLVSSLQKIAIRSGNIEDVPNWHHFSIRQRIDFLLSAHNNPERGRRHHRKLYGWAAALILAVALVSTGSSWLESTTAVQDLAADVQLRMITRELEETPKDADLRAAFGGLLFEEKRYEEAARFLRNAIRMDPNHAEALNNLAWLYATAPEPHFQPEEALRLAQRAAEENPQPHVLDTLAEAYYVNQEYDKALQTIERALAKKPGNRSYYLEQKEKFAAAKRGDAPAP